MFFECVDVIESVLIEVFSLIVGTQLKRPGVGQSKPRNDDPKGLLWDYQQKAKPQPLARVRPPPEVLRTATPLRLLNYTKDEGAKQAFIFSSGVSFS